MTYHVPIMLPEVMELIRPEERLCIVDFTLGGAGHSTEMLRRMKADGHLFGIDRDDEAICEAERRIAEEFPERKGMFTAIKGNFFDAKTLLAEKGVEKVDAILADLGVSSHQFDTPERGFSHRFCAKLDMRLDRSGGKTAYDIVNGYTETELRRIFFDYGEEKFSAAIAKNIIKQRQTAPIETTTELVEIIKSSMPAKALKEKGHPASRVFQALRIETNSEIDGLEQALRDAVEMLSVGGVIAVITFHSLEDRIVKNLFRELQDPCICDKRAPICTCGRKPSLEIITRKPIMAGEEELERNPRARSAKLRAARKI